MSTDQTIPPPPRTEAEVMRDIAEAAVRLTMLELELKRIRNPNGLTLGDLEGVFAGAGLNTDLLDVARARIDARPRDVVETAT